MFGTFCHQQSDGAWEPGEGMKVVRERQGMQITVFRGKIKRRGAGLWRAKTDRGLFAEWVRLERVYRKRGPRASGVKGSEDRERTGSFWIKIPAEGRGVHVLGKSWNTSFFGIGRKNREKLRGWIHSRNSWKCNSRLFQMRALVKNKDKYGNICSTLKAFPSLPGIVECSSGITFL